MLDDFPQELLLTVLARVRVSDITSLRCLNKAWNNFITQNESTIFHTAAVVDHDVPPSLNSLPDAMALYSPRALNDLSTWKDLYARLTQIKNSWSGITPSTITFHQYTGGSAVHRFKIDEKAGLIIATCSVGGITVTDITASKWYDGRSHNPDRNPAVIAVSAMLWALPRYHVRSYAHCEYGHGYLIFDRFGESKEIWRLAEYDYYYPQPSSSNETPAVIPAARPDARQKAASNRALETWLVSGDENDWPPRPRMIPQKKGHFVAWALLHPPTPTRAFRFVYPFLLVASFELAYLYDVRTGVMVQEIGDVQETQHGPDPQPTPPPTALGDLYYVEHSPHHVFICGDTCLRIFSRQTGRHVYDIPAIYSNYGQFRWTISTQREIRNRPSIYAGEFIDDNPMSAWEKVGSALYRHEVVREENRREPFVDRLMAAHVSPCGNYLTVLLETSRALIIRDLDRIIKGEVSLLDSTIEVQLGRPSRFSRYLAFENGRVGVATRNGIFIVIPHPSFFTSAPLSASPPTVLRVYALNDPFILENITCLQMTQTGLFVNWSPTDHIARYVAEDLDANGMHTAHEDIFWEGLGLPLGVGHQITGNAFIEEDEMLFGPPMDSVVLSVDFVPT